MPPIFAGHADVVQLLLQRKANPLAQNKAGKTALNVAKNDAVRALIQQAIDAAAATPATAVPTLSQPGHVLDTLEDSSPAQIDAHADTQAQTGSRKRPSEQQLEQSGTRQRHEADHHVTESSKSQNFIGPVTSTKTNVGLQHLDAAQDDEGE